MPLGNLNHLVMYRSHLMQYLESLTFKDTAILIDDWEVFYCKIGLIPEVKETLRVTILDDQGCYIACLVLPSFKG